MNWKGWLAAGVGASAGMLVYGALVEANRLVLERRRLKLRGWPERLSGTRIAVLADLHVRDSYSEELAAHAVAMALDESPDFVVLAGDLVGYWKPESVERIGRVLEPLVLMEGRALAVPGNREYWDGDPDLLEPILDQLNIRFLRNEAWHNAGITWVGIDSANVGMADPFQAMAAAHLMGHEPIVVVWHEPDLVDWLPSGGALQISGHTHGGQFRTPWGWPPMTTRNGKKYLEGFFPEAPTPLYVSRGVGVTGPPSRLFCPPEVSLLIVEPGDPSE